MKDGRRVDPPTTATIRTLTSDIPTHTTLKGGDMALPSDKRRTVDEILGGIGDGFNYAWDSVAAAGDDFEPIPPGVYRCLVADGRLAESSNGKTSYKITFTIIEGPHSNRMLWLDCWLTRNALHLAKRDLAKIGIHRPDQLRQPPPTGIVVDVRVAVRARDDGTSHNRVAGFKVVEDAPPPGTFDPDPDEGEGDDTEADDEVPF